MVEEEDCGSWKNSGGETRAFETPFSNQLAINAGGYALPLSVRVYQSYLAQAEFDLLTRLLCSSSHIYPLRSSQFYKGLYGANKYAISTLDY
jgi:hypothetical protein